MATSTIVHNPPVASGGAGAADFTNVDEAIGSNVYSSVENTDNTNAASHAVLELKVGGTSGGSPKLTWTIPGGTSWQALNDNATDEWLLTKLDGSVPGIRIRVGAPGVIINGGASAVGVDGLEVRGNGFYAPDANIRVRTDFASSTARIDVRNLSGGTERGDLKIEAAPNSGGTSRFGLSATNSIFIAAGVDAAVVARMGIGTVASAPVHICTANASRVEIDAVGSVAVGASLATTATDGDLYIPSCAGVPTGVPTAKTGLLALRGDRTNNRLYMYSGGAWVLVGP
jgi:hypothetical protein